MKREMQKETRKVIDKPRAIALPAESVPPAQILEALGLGTAVGGAPTEVVRSTLESIDSANVMIADGLVQPRLIAADAASTESPPTGLSSTVTPSSRATAPSSKAPSASSLPSSPSARGWNEQSNRPSPATTHSQPLFLTWQAPCSSETPRPTFSASAQPAPVPSASSSAPAYARDARPSRSKPRRHSSRS